MAENLRQAHEIVARVFQVAVSHRMTQQVRKNLEAANGGVLAAQIPHSSVGQRASLTDEDEVALHRRPAFQVRLQRPSSRERERNRALLAALAEPEDYGAAALAQHQVVEFEADQIADPTPRKQEDVKDRRRPDIATEFDLPQQLADLGSVQPLRSKLLAA